MKKPKKARKPKQVKTPGKRVCTECGKWMPRGEKYFINGAGKVHHKDCNDPRGERLKPQKPVSGYIKRKRNHLEMFKAFILISEYLKVFTAEEADTILQTLIAIRSRANE